MLSFPVALVVSGGHTSLYVVNDPGSYGGIGRTRDDAAARPTTKLRSCSARYPGGPIVDKRARDGDDEAIAFPKLV